MYDWQFLLDIRNNYYCYESCWLGEPSLLNELGLLSPSGPKETTDLPGNTAKRKH